MYYEGHFKMINARNYVLVDVEYKGREQANTDFFASWFFFVYSWMVDPSGIFSLSLSLSMDLSDLL